MAFGEDWPNAQLTLYGCSQLPPPVLIGLPDTTLGRANFESFNHPQRQRTVNFIGSPDSPPRSIVGAPLSQ
jgi:hypothetical protein